MKTKISPLSSTISTRRKFLTGISTILAYSSAPAHIIKSCIGASHSFSIEKTKPYSGSYVMDGLIAFWDAEWNAGLNLHDPSSRILVNLCGGSPIYLSDSTIVHRKHLSFTSSQENDYGGISDPMPDIPLPGSPITNEAVFFTQGGPNWSDSRLAFYYRNGQVGINHTNTYVGMGRYRNSSTSFGLCNSYDNIGQPSTFISVSNQVLAWNNQIGYVNASPVLTRNTPLTSPFTSDDYMKILYATLPDSQILFSSLRIYNRSLSTDEIQQNFDFDNERFHLI